MLKQRLVVFRCHDEVGEYERHEQPEVRQVEHDILQFDAGIGFILLREVVAAEQTRQANLSLALLGIDQVLVRREDSG